MEGMTPLLRAVRRAGRREVIGRFADAWFAGAIAAVVVFLIGILLQALGFGSGLLTIIIVLSGLLVAIARWTLGPDSAPLAVASRLDSSNNTRDLLATAYSMSDLDDPWARTLRAQADDASTRLAYPSPLGHHTLRKHLAASSALAASVIVAMILAPHAAPPSPDTSPLAAESASSSNPSMKIRPAIRKPGEGASQSPAVPSADTRQSSGRTAATDRPGESGNDATGEGRSDSGADATLTSTHTPGVGPRTALTSTPTQGSGQESTDTAGSATSDNTGASDTASRLTAAPWQAEAWSTSSKAAMESVSSRNVPQDRRELVRAYFDR